MKREITIPQHGELRKAARQLLTAAVGHNVIAFYGGMGAGKTTLIQAICELHEVREPATSPTFAIVNEYESQVTGEPIYHFDFYRIKRMEEALDIGFEEYMDSGCYCFIEWPEMIEPLLPPDTFRVHITVTDDGTRLITWEE